MNVTVAPGGHYAVDIPLRRDRIVPVVFGRLLDGTTGQPIANAQVRLLETNDSPVPEVFKRTKVLVVGTDFLGRYQIAIRGPNYVDLHSNGSYDCKDSPSEPYYCEHVYLGGKLRDGELYEQNIVLHEPRAKKP